MLYPVCVIVFVTMCMIVFVTTSTIVHLKSPGIRIQTRSLIAHASLVNLQVTNECNAQVHERVKQLASAIRKFTSK